MIAQESAGRELVNGVGRFAGHVVALMVGLILMVVGLAMGVSIVLLPFGIPLGLVGLFVFVWGLFGKAQEKELPAPTPARAQQQNAP